MNFPLLSPPMGNLLARSGSLALVRQHFGEKEHYFLLCFVFVFFTRRQLGRNIQQILIHFN